MALQSDHAWTASTNHFQFNALAQTEFFKALHMFASAHNVSDHAALAVCEPIQGDALSKSSSHRRFLIETHSHLLNHDSRIVCRGLQAGNKKIPVRPISPRISRVAQRWAVLRHSCASRRS